VRSIIFGTRVSSASAASGQPSRQRTPAAGGRANSPDGGRPPTIIDVAMRAGVSKSVVSRALTGAKTVSQEARAAVLAAADELGYRPNAVARSLARRRSFNVGVMVSDLHNLFFAEILDGISAVAAADGYRMLIATGNRDPQAEADALNSLLELRSDGVILLGPRLDAAMLGRASREVPLALVGSVHRLRGVDSVTDDDLAGARLAVEHLAGLGHRRIAHVDGGGGAGSAERRAGYEETMRRLDLAREARVAAGDFTEEGGYRGARRLLSTRKPPTAIFASNDMAALGVLEALEEAGLRVPQDVSLVGYDNNWLAGLRHISLTTVHQPRREIGERAMKALLHRVERPRARARRLVLEPHLVVRSTTAPPLAGVRHENAPVKPARARTGERATRSER
jgi:DNA-binding LacI/PurR family transcriptional regulator